MSEYQIKHKKRNTIIGCCIAGAAVLAIAVISLIFIYGRFGVGNQKIAASYADNERFSQGISIEGIDIAGMTKEEALNALDQAVLYPAGYDIQLTLDDETVTVTGKDLPFDLHLQETIDEAYEYNWYCTKLEHSSRVSQLIAEPKDFSLKPTLIHNELEAVLTELTAPFHKEEQEPTITGYYNGSFAISDPVNGRAVDVAALASEITALLATEKTGVIAVPVTEIPCKKNVDDIKANMHKLGSFSTVSTNTANGNHNMKLAANATNGTILQPGEQFSFNNTTGDTTNSSNGYLPAGAISGGELVQEYGGGICQVSSTIYGAALRSNITIISRGNHTFPSSYVPIGLDAAVSYGALDFVIRNDTEYPVYIAAGMDGTTVWVTFYGYQSPDYDTIEVNGWITETISKPQTQYNTDNSLTPNPNPLSAAKLQKSGNVGYRANASRTYYKNGTAVKTESLSSSYYPAFADVYVIPPKGEQTTTPTPEPAPEPAPEPTPEPAPEPNPEAQPKPDTNTSSAPSTSSETPTASTAPQNSTSSRSTTSPRTAVN